MITRKITLGALFFLVSNTALVWAQEKPKKDSEKDIEGVSIKATAKKGAESNIITVQKKSVEVVERVGSAQLDKQGVGDVATAVTKATGTQKDESTGMVVVRGMGDRTISTTLNGLSIPSNDPENRNIELGIFKTNMVEYISVEKVFNPRMIGNMAGANIDIVSKEHTGKPMLKIGLGSSLNTSVIGKDFYLQNGPDYFGFNVINQPKLANTAYKFSTSLKDKEILNPINSSLNIELGKVFNIGKAGKLSVFGYGGFDNDYYFANDGISRTYPYQNVPTKDFKYNKYNYQTNTTGLLSLVYRINPNHKLRAVANYIHYTDQTLKNFNGFYNDILNDKDQGFVLVRRAEFKNTDLIIGQLGGENRITDKLNLSWNVGYNNMTSKRPDRMQNITRYIYATGLYSFSNNSTGDNNRYFDSLNQVDYQGDIHFDYTFNDKAKFTLGYQGVQRQSDFTSIQYNFKPNFSYNLYVDPTNYDTFFNQSNFAAGLFSINTFRGTVNNPYALLPQTYNATQTFHSGYGNLDYKFSEKLVAQLGLRYDNVQQFIKYDVAIQTFGNRETQDFQKFMPALNIKYSVSDKQNLRLAASKTYTLPITKEFAPFSYEDIDVVSIGNPKLYPSDNYNADIKWEFFPAGGEVLSVSAFGKFIQNPISRVNLLSSANTQSFVNVGDTGRVLGVEVELRKDIYKFSNKSKLYTFVNASYLNTRQDISNDKVFKETKGAYNTNFKVTESRLQGAADILANANLGLNHAWRDNTMDFVVSYSYVGESLYSVGYAEMGNFYSLPLHLLDANLKFKFNKQIGVGVSAKNIMNTIFRREQRNDNQTLLVESFTKGSKFGLSVSYDF